MNSGLPAFTEAFHPKRAFVVGTGGVSLEVPYVLAVAKTTI